MRYALTTFGCQMNVHDSERMHEVLRGAGHVEVAGVEEADLVVLNTCSVREKAEQKLRSEVGRLALLKRKNPELVLVVAGCVAQQEGERLLPTMPAVDVVMGPDAVAELPRLLADVALGAPPIVRTGFDVDEPRFLSLAEPRGGPTAYVTVMKGCDERCSFCIVPTTRGPERYRPSAEVVAEIATLVAAGAREITLLGQTVNSYTDPTRALPRAPGARDDDPDESEFAALLRLIACDVPGLARLRYTSPHPRHVTPSLVAAHADLDVLCRHVHLPVQSGSDRLLRRMIRRYDRDEYVARARALSDARPDLTLSTDVIVGFPGETDDDFERTLSLVEEVPFRGLFGFKYSPRPGTPALRLGDDVPESNKSERLTRLFELSDRLLAEHLGRLVGSTQRVLVEGSSKPVGDSRSRGGSVCGRTERHEIVHLDDAGFDLVGEIVDVVVVRANKHSLQGELSPEARRGRRLRPARSEAGAAPRRVLPVVAP